jgi:hypothetical protein
MYKISKNKFRYYFNLSSRYEMSFGYLHEAGRRYGMSQQQNFVP